MNNRTPKMISSNNPCKIKTKTTEQTTTTTTTNTLLPLKQPNNNHYNSSCSELSTSCCSSSPINQPKIKTKQQHQINNQRQKLNTTKHSQNTNINNKKPLLIQKPIQFQNQQQQQQQHQNLKTRQQVKINNNIITVPPPTHGTDHTCSPKYTNNHFLYEPTHQLNRSLSNHTPQINTTTTTTTTPHLRNSLLNHSSPYSLVEDQFDSARINRKILDLEISNASLLAINGALERTKVNQQNEIRTIKKKLLDQQINYYPYNNNNNSEQSQTSSSLGRQIITTRTLKKKKKKKKIKQEEEEEGLDLGSDQEEDDQEEYEEEEYEEEGDEDEEEEEESMLNLDRLMAEDEDFKHVIKCIEDMISSGTKAINFKPLLINSNSNSYSYSDQSSITNNNIIGKSKVLNPIQAQKFLSNFDNNDNKSIINHDSPHLHSSLLLNHS